MRQTVAMEPISRRLFLAGCVAAVVGACSNDGDGAAESPPPDSGSPTTGQSPTTVAAATPTEPPAIVLPTNPFTLGVASGDPGVRSVVLWTRLAPDPLATGGGMPSDDIAVDWEVARDPQFDEVLSSGSATATAANAHSVHVRVE